MAFSPAEEAAVKLLIAQNSALLNLAGAESTIISKLGATKVTLADIEAASGVNLTDLLLARQGTDDVSVTLELLQSGILDGLLAKDIGYDNETSGLDAEEVQAAIDELAAEKQDKIMYPSTPKLFAKSNPYAALLGKTSAFALVTAQDFYVDLNGANSLITQNTTVTMPGTPVVGTDYAAWVQPDGSVVATNNHVTPPITSAVYVGGFHYAPGGNATGTSGGNSTPQINEYSIWDKRFCVNAPDPRGKALVAGGFWTCIYMLNSDHIVNGASRYGVAIADGSTPPKIPTQFGGTGSNSFGSLTWYEAALCLRSHGLRMPTYDEHLAFAYGVTEATSRGSDPGNTGLDAARTSKWGIMQATGNLYTWGANLAGPYGSAAWTANTGGRGSTYLQPNAALFGGIWPDGSNAGSGCAFWYPAPSYSNYNIGVRGVGDHLILV